MIERLLTPCSIPELALHGAIGKGLSRLFSISAKQSTRCGGVTKD